MVATENEFRKGWPAVVAVFLGVALATPSIPMYGFAFFITAVSADFGWDIGTTTGGLAVFTVCMALGGPVIGRLIDRLGAFPVLVGSLPITFGALASLTLVDGNRALYYALWALIGLSGVGNNPIVWTRLITQSFRLHRGLALGIASSGIAFFTLVVTPLARFAVENWGWKSALLLLSTIPPIVLIPVAFLMLAPFRKAASPAARAAETGLELATIFRSWRFAIILFVHAAMAVVPGMMTHLERFYHTRDLTTAEIVGLTSTMGLSLLGGRLLAGYLADKLWAPGLLAGAMAMMGAATLGLAIPHDNVLIYGLCLVGIGLAAGAEFELGAYITSRYFGLRNYGVVFGIFYSVTLGLGGLWSMLIGRLADASGGYTEPFQILAVFLGLGAASLCFMGHAPRFDETDKKKGDAAEAAEPPLRSPASVLE